MTSFNNLVHNYTHNEYIGSGDMMEKDILHQFGEKFSALYNHLRPICAYIYGQRTRHDDKASTAFKNRIAKHIYDTWPEGSRKSWNKALELGSASDDYKDFLTERAYWYESWDSIQHLRDTIKQYIINAGQRLAN